MKKGLCLTTLLGCLFLLGGCATGSFVEQTPRDLPEDWKGKVRLPVSGTRLAVYSELECAGGLASRLKALGYTLSSAVPCSGMLRPHVIIEPVRCAQSLERCRDEVALVSVVVVRVRRAGELSADGQIIEGLKDARSFQGVSRISLGRREFNDERISADERSRGMEAAWDKLVRIGVFHEAIGSFVQ